MTENLCLSYHRHSILNMAECESLNAFRDTFKELFIFYEKMNWVQRTFVFGRGCSQAHISLDIGRMSPRQELSSRAKQLHFTGGITCTGTSVESQVRPYFKDKFVRRSVGTLPSHHK